MPKALTQRTLLLTGLAMLAFAGNSLLCRLALKNTPIDAISFTSLRLIAGALMLWLLLRWRNGGGQMRGNWRSAAALFTYTAAFSLAYVHLDAGIGAPVHAFRISLVVALSSPGRRDHRRSNLESHAGCGGREAAPILDGAPDEPAHRSAQQGAAGSVRGSGQVGRRTSRAKGITEWHGLSAWMDAASAGWRSRRKRVGSSTDSSVP